MNLSPATVQKLQTGDGLNKAPAWMTVGMELTVDLDSAQYVGWPTDTPGGLRDRTLIFVLSCPIPEQPPFWTIQEWLHIDALDSHPFAMDGATA